MKTRPWPLVLLAVLQFLTPVFTILFNAIALGVSPLRVASWVFARNPFEVFETLMLMPIAGLAIYVMRRWSYMIFLVAIFWSAVRNLSHWNYSVTTIPAPALIFVYISEAAFVGYFLLPSVRSTYFDPNIRWWEHKPRYLLELAAKVILKGGSAQVGQGTILNLSEGGAFIQMSQKLAKGQMIALEFLAITLPFSVDGQIVHIREMEEGKFCYGVQFSLTKESGAAMRRFASALDALGYNERDGRLPMAQEFKKWALTLLRTGKGLLPEIQKRRN